MKFGAKIGKIIVEPVRIKHDENGKVFQTKGKSIEFINGIYETEDAKEIDFLKKYGEKTHEVFEMPSKERMKEILEKKDTKKK